MICNVVRIWDKVCCLVRFLFNESRILVREGRFGLEWFILLILLLVVEELVFEGIFGKGK